MVLHVGGDLARAVADLTLPWAEGPIAAGPTECAWVTILMPVSTRRKNMVPMSTLRWDISPMNGADRLILAGAREAGRDLFTREVTR